MFEPRGAISRWTAGHQKIHSLYWSAFLPLASDYDAGRFRDRYKPMPTAEAASGLLNHWRSAAEPRVRPTFKKLALWALAPRVFGTGLRPDGDAPGTALDQVAGPFRDAFAEAFRFEPGADRGWGPDRLLVPELPELGIEGASLETRAYQRAVRARLETVVIRPFRELRRIVEPWNWSSSPFWAEVPPCHEISEGGFAESALPASVRLPGGLWVEANKERPVELTVDLAVSAFEARIDYRARESGGGGSELPDGRRLSGESLPVEIENFQGFLQVEKLAGRPGACRVIAEREARFLDFNHEYFGAETVMYWLGSELIAFVEDAQVSSP